MWKLGSETHPPTNQMVEKFAKLLQLAHDKEEGIVDLIWGPDLEVFDIPLDEDGIILNSRDFVVSPQELRDALTIVRQNREVKKNESNS